MRVIIINGPINAGKTTIGRALAAILPGGRFIDGDDHGISRSVPFAEMIDRAVLWVAHQIAIADAPYLVIAYPLREQDFAVLQSAAAARTAGLFVATLALPMDIALTNRGSRPLDDWERARIVEMYDQGYANRAFSDVILDQVWTPSQMAAMLAKTILQGSDTHIRP